MSGPNPPGIRLARPEPPPSTAARAYRTVLFGCLALGLLALSLKLSDCATLSGSAGVGQDGADSPPFSDAP